MLHKYLTMVEWCPVIAMHCIIQYALQFIINIYNGIVDNGKICLVKCYVEILTLCTMG